MTSLARSRALGWASSGLGRLSAPPELGLVKIIRAFGYRESLGQQRAAPLLTVSKSLSALTLARFYSVRPTRLLPASRILPLSITSTSDGYKRFQSARIPFYQTRSFYWICGAGCLLSGIYYYRNLETVPISGRRRFNDISPEIEQLIGNHTLEAVMNEYGHLILPTYHPYSVMARRVAGRLIQANKYADTDWEVFVISDPQANAFVLPNGKIFVFSGIIPIAMSDEGLAAILGHELHVANLTLHLPLSDQIAHHIARHSAEKLTWAKVLLIPQILATVILGTDLGPLFRGLIMELAIMRPFSRKCESEADFIGLEIMAKACYNPNAAIGIWERMSAAQSHRQPSQFLSTHPSDESRIKNIQEWLPQATQTYTDSGCDQMMAYARPFLNMIQKRQ
ncbi:hypothetical protein BASA50_001111 [Batrachochytrium salamandrivorans]|uniref:Peptidase M48 domain-containing protein n=1 Tax=Batrachochytrium salamandrivorans TaxID=1357716 RepID=A0ABQ8ERN0_9FUNG|nr:hypothetical protein BASA62_003589 [Batrachochytrium salamandrivorans]KAH6585502.1 hypothetical protein BASA50_001111 [Batrachochytrium salamandrivorans]